jgi:hypothetical protein
VAWLKLEGWCLPTPGTRTLSGEPGHFFLNLHLGVSSRPLTIEGQAGYLLWDKVNQTYFVAISEAEMSMLLQMAA